MIRHCAHVRCSQEPTKRIGYWGQRWDLCEEHADLIGDDGSMNEPSPELEPILMDAET